MIKGNMLIAHGGGPTPVINNSLRGAIEEAKRHKEIEIMYGARFGAEGILGDDLIDLGKFSAREVELLSQTPASAIGSCRRKLGDEDYPAVLECFRRNNIRYFFYNGGNDSMDTCNKIHKLAVQSGYELNVVGIPKTIDNDLVLTDHSPGYGSAAKYAAMSALELSQDVASLPIHVVIMEAMGRNAGWITAATALFSDKMPCEHLVYLPEVPFDKERFLSDVTDRFAKGCGLLVTASEGLRYADGSEVADSGVVDGFGHKVPGGVAQTLADMIISGTNLKARSEKPGLLGRVSMSQLSKSDRREAYEAGAFAVASAIEGKSGFMVAVNATRKGGYSASMELAPLGDVANAEKKFPPEWINGEKNGVTREFIEYCLPLADAAPTEYAVFHNA